MADRPRASRAAAPRRSLRLTERDRELLAFAAEHKLVLASQIAVLLRSSEEAARRRLLALRGEGLVRQDRPFDDQAASHQITRGGLGAIESGLGPPKTIDRAHYRHDVGVGWLWLAAGAGAWGGLTEVVSERHMRSVDAVDRGERGDRFGVRLGGTGPRGRERLHYPDLLLVDRDGRRIAVELELSAKTRGRIDGILSGYAMEARIDVVLYLVDRPSVARAVQTSARRLGISDLVHVQSVQWGRDAPPGARGRAVERSRSQSAAAVEP